jgi:SAM-dependent methyltransferase
MNYTNSWDNEVRSASYARLEFPNTYHLAYRDLPQIIAQHTHGKRALDFGCGTGRSTRFLSNLGFETIGVDVSEAMIKLAVEKDPTGDYKLVEDGVYNTIPGNFDLITSIFTFDNIPAKNRVKILSALGQKLNNTGILIMLDSNPELYTHEWASFSTAPFPGNKTAHTGDPVYTVMLDVDDRSPVEDYFYTLRDYFSMFHQANLRLETYYAPLGKVDEPFEWKSELTIAPWIIYVLMSNPR